MHLIEAIILGFVQGLTEFLPISSSAHLRIFPEIFGWGDPGAAFTAVIQLGAIALALRLGPGPGSLAALAVLLGTGLFGTMRALRHARLIADTPTARIASAAISR